MEAAGRTPAIPRAFPKRSGRVGGEALTESHLGSSKKAVTPQQAGAKHLRALAHAVSSAWETLMQPTQLSPSYPLGLSTKAACPRAHEWLS